ncbi:hypothetical protein [Bradyrhizobium brasilense]|uniref:hypothetical protein n=1 Tax=Bradyrhizobium brasilense TaxID=1419277 RepID=UPI001E4EF7D9|nr:hypothetical protein [Bradyrhizobium brasilense]MCC8975884.1 hypothetical protein [Bradyrhizobium brasilense]
MQIDMFRRALDQRFDPLTTDRLKVGLAEMEAKKAALHPETTGVGCGKSWRTAGPTLSFI